MKNPIISLIFAALPLSLFAADFSGIWKSEFDSQIGQQKYTFTFKQDGTNITGKANSEIGEQKRETALIEGKVDGDKVSFVEMLDFQGNDLRITYLGNLAADGSQIQFHREVGDFAKEDIVAKRTSGAPTTTAINLTGRWKADFQTQRGLQKYTFNLKQDGATVTGHASVEMTDQKREADLQEGKWDGSTVTFTEKLRIQDNDVGVVFTGKISGDEIKFTRKVADFATEDLVAKREK